MSCFCYHGHLATGLGFKPSSQPKRYTHRYALTHREADSPTESIGFAMLRWPAEAIYRIALEESCFCTLLVQTVEGSVLMWSFENFNCMVGTE